jgi:hypothetical protein
MYVAARRVRSRVRTGIGSSWHERAIFEFITAETGWHKLRISAHSPENAVVDWTFEGCDVTYLGASYWAQNTTSTTHSINCI